jgi:hypothetical protein
MLLHIPVLADRQAVLARRARNALGTATQCTRRNDSPALSAHRVDVARLVVRGVHAVPQPGRLRTPRYFIIRTKAVIEIPLHFCPFRLQFLS